MTEGASKPPYRVPAMDEIRAIPWNGFTAVSTFSGCGGSSLGYRMAGFKVLWASEFVEAARDTYRVNAAPDTILDGRDIREVTGADILAATGLQVGELDLFDGSPPCASFSTAGSREKSWGKVKSYSDTEQRSDDLFFEYARLVRDIQPRVFVAENVSGLVKGTSKGYFKIILARLRDAGYRVQAKVLDASWLGVPQARQRLIFIGVREDLDTDPAFPKPLPYRYTVRDALPWISEQGNNGGFGAGGMRPADQPSPTIGIEPSTGNGRYPPSLVKVMASDIGGVTRHQVMLYALIGPVYSEDGKPLDPETGHPIGLIGSLAREWDTAPGDSSDRYFNLKRNDLDKPSQTVTVCGGGAVGVTHAVERRRFTLGELRAISGFPPDFQLTGTYAQRWERIGRAVPPVMMAAIATAVRDGVLVPLRERGVI